MGHRTPKQLEQLRRMHASPTSRAKLSAAAKRRWQDPAYKEMMRERFRNWAAETPGGRRRVLRERLYKEFVIKQDGEVCAVCRRPSRPGKRLALDHIHGHCSEPGGCEECIRGLLCDDCNAMIGYGRDNPEHLERGANYLRTRILDETAS